MAVNIETFRELKILVGKVMQVEDFPEAKMPSYKLTIDFGKHGMKKSSAQLPKYYLKKELIGQQVICVTGFPPKQIANFMSECLVLGAIKKDGEIVLLKPDKNVEPGAEIA